MSKKKGPNPSTYVVDSSVKFTESIVYAAGNLQERQNLDLFEPLQPPSTKIPLIVYIHGGAWTERDKCQYRHLGDFFVQRGFSCAVINYRLSQGSYDIPDELQVKHPVHTQDCGLALCWLADHADKYSYDKDRIYIVGHSAGAFMASLLVLQPEIYFPPQRSAFTIRGVIGVEGIYDLNQILKDYQNYLQWVVAPAFDGAAAEFDAASPTAILKLTKKDESTLFPRFLIVHAEKDELVNVPQSSHFVEALRAQWGPADRTESFVTSHQQAFHNSVVDQIQDGFEILAPAILDFIHNVEKL